MKLFVDFWKITKIWKYLEHRNKELFLFWRLDVQNTFKFPTCKNSQKWVKIKKSTDTHSSFDGRIQENIDLSDIYWAVRQLFIFVSVLKSSGPFLDILSRCDKKTQLMFCFENLEIVLGIANFQTLAFVPLNEHLYIIDDNDFRKFF